LVPANLGLDKSKKPTTPKLDAPEMEGSYFTYAPSFSHEGAKASFAVAIGVKMLAHKHSVNIKIAILRVSVTIYTHQLSLGSLIVLLRELLRKPKVLVSFLTAFLVFHHSR
jgi:hypothetical protein